MVGTRNIKLLIFDFDGTLHDLKADWQEIRRTIGIAGSNELLGDALERLKEEGNSELLKNVEKIEEKALAGDRLDPSTKRLLNRLAKEFKIAVLSRNSGSAISKFFKREGLNMFFVVGRNDVEKLKPQPEGIEKILEHFKVHKSDALLIGDTYHDVEAARSAGIKSIVVGDKIKGSSAAERADYYISSISEMIPLLGIKE
jgi:HAD superfamily hydrolase (TIGR01549 family)